MRLRIAQIASLTETVPPKGHGSIETLISLITEELGKRGHEVVLFASGDSQTTAELRSVSRQSFRGLGGPDVLLEYTHLVKAFQRAGDCDVIHNHHDGFAVGLREMTGVPTLTTIHSPYDSPGVFSFAEQFAASPCVALSEAHRRTLPPSLNVRHIIPNGLPIERFPFQADKEDFLLFLGRMHPDKGPEQAIEVARQTGLPLVIAAQLDQVTPYYWEAVIKPKVDGVRVVFAGEADFAQKTDLLRRARAVLFPVQWEEPFGLVMIEALACGTPVVALRRGAVPEVLRHGETGLIVDSLAELVEAVRQVGAIDPHRCRQEAEGRFSVGTMVDRYLEAYADTRANPGLGSGLGRCAEPAVAILAGELAAQGGLPIAEARRRLDEAPRLLAEAWWQQMPSGPDGRGAFLDGEPLWIFERANRSLTFQSRQQLEEVVEIARRDNLERWLSYRSDLANLVLLLPGPVDVIEAPGPVRDFVSWRLARRGVAGRMLPYADPATLPEAAYDGIVAHGGLELERDPLATLAALARALRPGGLLLTNYRLMQAIDSPWALVGATGWGAALVPAAFGLEAVAARGGKAFRRLS